MSASAPNRSAWIVRVSRRTRGVLVLASGVLAIAAPFVFGPFAVPIVAWLMVVCGVLEIFEDFRAANQRRGIAWSGAISLAIGALLLVQPRLVVDGLSFLLAISFFFDALGCLWTAIRGVMKRDTWLWPLARAVGDLAACIVLATGWPFSGLWVAAILVGFRMLGVGGSLLLGDHVELDAEPDRNAYPDASLGLPAHAAFAEANDQFDRDDLARRPYDVSYACVFVLVFFAIHVGRMEVEWNLVGFFGPIVAVLGDVGTALFIAFALALPTRMSWRWATRPIERRGWTRTLAAIDPEEKNTAPVRWWSSPWRWWLNGRMRFAHRIAAMRRSPAECFRWGLRVGLPATAILIALNPIWGFSWYFNSENWASGVWNTWAEHRSDGWREAMVQAVQSAYGPSPDLFEVKPAGIQGGDFSFLVIGDTGEGDASQHCLRDQYLFLGQRPDVKFLVVSSDVIYPAGAMADYEAKFYLPFKGFTKPIYAIPGNHDWYDALEGFNANFLEPKAAKAAMHARIEKDSRLTTTTDRHIDALVAEAERLRGEFGIQNGLQRGPFFDLHTETFSFIAVDTGVKKTLDPQQQAWLENSLARAKGKFLFVLLGHPLYAGGHYQGEHDPAFASLHDLLKKHDARIVMAGDTHDYEHFIEPSGAKEKPDAHHFVNGGGGAYLSIGTALDWPKTPAVPSCSIYPRKDQLIKKFDRELPMWKQPMWYWVKNFGAWPSSAESLAGAFDNNRAPFFQSFVEVRVEPSQRRVRLIVHGANGPLRWGDLQCYGAIRPAGKTDEDVVEIEYPM